MRSRSPALTLETQARYVLLGAVAEAKRVLDLGCADGRGLVTLAEAEAAEITATSDEPEWVSARLAEAGIEGVEVTAEKPGPLPFDDAAFDLIICHDLPERIGASPELVGELRRVLDPQGFLAVAVANPAGNTLGGLWGRPEQSSRTYEELYALLAPVFGTMSAFGQSPLAASLFYDLASQDEDPGLVFDRSLLADDEQPGWFVLLFGPEQVKRDDLSIVQLPFDELLAEAAAPSAPASDEALQAALAEAHEERDALAARLEQATAGMPVDGLAEATLRSELEAAASREAALMAERDAAIGRGAGQRAELEAVAHREASLVAERDAAMAREAALLAERNGAAAGEHALAAERDAALAREATLLAERESFAAREAILVAERDAAMTREAALVAERDNLTSREVGLVAELAAAHDRTAAVISERDQLLARERELLADRETLVTERDALASRAATLDEQRTTVAESLRSEAAARIEALEAELVVANRRLTDAEGRAMALEDRIAQHASERDQSLARVGELEAATAAAEQRLAELRELERDSVPAADSDAREGELEQALAGAQAERTELESQLVRARKDGESLEQQIRDLLDETQQLRQALDVAQAAQRDVASQAGEPVIQVELAPIPGSTFDLQRREATEDGAAQTTADHVDDHGEPREGAPGLARDLAPPVITLEAPAEPPPAEPPPVITLEAPAEPPPAEPPPVIALEAPAEPPPAEPPPVITLEPPLEPPPAEPASVITLEPPLEPPPAEPAPVIALELPTEPPHPADPAPVIALEPPTEPVAAAPGASFDFAPAAPAPADSAASFELAPLEPSAPSPFDVVTAATPHAAPGFELAPAAMDAEPTPPHAEAERTFDFGPETEPAAAAAEAPGFQVMSAPLTPEASAEQPPAAGGADALDGGPDLVPAPVAGPAGQHGIVAADLELHALEDLDQPPTAFALAPVSETPRPPGARPGEASFDDLVAEATHASPAEASATPRSAPAEALLGELELEGSGAPAAPAATPKGRAPVTLDDLEDLLATSIPPSKPRH